MNTPKYQAENYRFFDLIAEPLLLTNTMGDIIYANEQTHSIAHISQHLKNNNNLKQLISDKDWPLLAQILKNDSELPQSVAFEIQNSSDLKILDNAKFSLNYTPSKAILPTGEMLFKIIEQKKITPEKSADAIPDSINSSQSFYVIRTDLDGNYTYANDYFYERFNFKKNEIIGRSAMETIFADDHETCLAAVEKCIQNPANHVLVQLRKPKGEKDLFYTNWEFSAITNADQAIVAIQCIGYDSTETVMIEQNLIQTEQQLNSLLEYLPDIVLVHQHGIIRYANQTVYQKYKLKKKETIGQNVLDFVHPDDKKLVAQQMKMDNGKLNDYEIRLKWPGFADKSVIVHTTSFIFKGEPAILTILIDITERKNIMLALKESEKKFKLLADSTSFGIMIYQDEKIVYANPAGETITGLSMNEILSMRYWELVAPEFQQRAKAYGKARQNNTSAPHSYEIELTHKNGHRVWGLITGVSIDYQGKPAGLISVADVTPQKQVEQQLKEQASRMNAIVKALPDILIVSDRNGNFLEVYGHETFDQLAAPNDINQPKHSNIILWHQLEDHLWAFKQCVDDQKLISLEYQLTINKKQYYFEARLSPIDDKRLLAIVRDISLRTELNNQVHYLSDLQNLLTRLANQFINLEAKHVNQATNKALKEIGEFMEVDRAYVFSYDWQKNIATNTFEWCAKDITSHIETSKNIQLDLFSDWIEIHLRGEVFLAENVEMLSDDSRFKNLLTDQQIKSLITFPLINEGICLGFVGLDSVKTERTWKPEEMAILKLFADLVTNLQIKANVNEKLKEAKAANAFITDNIADAVALTDSKGNYTFMSPSHERILGRGQELIGHSIFDYIHPEDISQVKAGIQLALETSLTQTLQYRHLHPKKDYIWVETTGMHYFDEQGNILGLITSRDIQQRKTAELELLKLSRALEQSSAAIIITNNLGCIEYVNPSFCASTGYQTHEVIGENPRILKSGYTSPQKYNELWDTILSGKSWKGTFKTKRKDGTFFYETATISPVIDPKGKTSHFIAIKEDITEQRRVRNELIKAKEQAEESNRLKTAFINNISHEIRTPLNGIIGFSELLVDENTSVEEKLEYLQILDASSDRLLKTVSDIMEVSLLASGNKKQNSESFDLNVLLNELKETFSKMCRKKNLRFELVIETDQLPQCFTDRSMLKKVLLELLSNAVKYTTEGFVRLNAKIERNQLLLKIEDSGCGIPISFQSKMFDYFSQLDVSSNRSYEGSGLGLSIAKEMLNLLDGTIDVQSVPNEGSQFSVKLPFDIRLANHDNLINNENATVEYHEKVLIVEDDKTNYLYLNKILSKEQREKTIWVTDGNEAVNACLTNKAITLVLMDIKIEGINGLEATRLIKRSRPEVKIIAISAYAMENDHKKALSAGCDDFISKPYNMKELRLKLHKFHFD